MVHSYLLRYVTVTADKLPMSDDDQAPMPSAPPTTEMDFIQGYDGIPMNDGRCGYYSAISLQFPPYLLCDIVICLIFCFSLSFSVCFFLQHFIYTVE